MSPIPSSSWGSSFAEQTITSQDDFVTQSNANILSYGCTSAYDFAQTSAASNVANLGSQIFNDLDGGQEPSDQTYSNTSRHADIDWQFESDFTESLDINFNNRDREFYEDCDASLHNPTVLHAAPIIFTMIAEDLDFDDSLYDDTEQIDYLDIDDVCHDSDSRSHTSYIPTDCAHQETLLRDWQWDLQRHEWVALKFEHPPYTTERQ
ncbi:uncharacterized protein RAG0_06036 [Rhynchosporium agropyri]|uniref:Uncharacterized protein n=1 Tax=Rhynchosporium agropyri TaxID=914238 RepID=A0A1E1KFV3_9HELO|nr:uncharacterized protein RAG0_06036 [Rhynchosporium agropyri]